MGLGIEEAQSVWIPRLSVSRVAVLAFGFGFWPLGFGLWPLGSGLWALGFCLPALGLGLWVVGFGLCALGFGLWAVASCDHRLVVSNQVVNMYLFKSRFF